MISLTVYFDDPWWVGVLELWDDDGLWVARYIFGAEPAAQEVYELVLDGRLARQALAGPPVAMQREPARLSNPKRVAREAARAVEPRGITPEVRAAVRLARVARRQERRVELRAERLRAAQEQRRKAQLKARERHRGR